MTPTALREARESGVGKRPGRCGARSASCLPTARPREWRLLRVDVPGDDDEPLLAAYCPDRAEREFGLSRRIDSGQAGPN